MELCRKDPGQAEGKLHILVNNSGTNFNAPLEKYTPEAFEKVMQLNTNALFALTRLALPLLESSSSHEEPREIEAFCCLLQGARLSRQLLWDLRRKTLQPPAKSRQFGSLPKKHKRLDDKV